MEIKSNKVYFFKFSKYTEVDNDNIEEEFEHPFFKDLANCLNKEEKKYIGFTDDDNLFARLSDYKISQLAELFRKYEFEFEIYDITNSVISGDIQKKYPEVEKLTPSLFEDFRYENTSVDDILDKINERGMDSLDDIDRKILNMN